MKKVKRYIGLFITIVMIFALYGCGSKSDKEAIINAIEKTNGIKSAKYKVKADITAEGMKQKQNEFPMDKLSIEVMGKSLKNDKNIKAEADIKANLSGISVGMKLFEEVSVKDGNTEFEMLIEIPEFIKPQFGPIFQNIDYLNINSGSLKELEKTMNDGQSPVKSDLDMFTNNPFAAQEVLLNNVKDYINKNGDKIIENKGEQEIEINGNKEKIKVYDMKFDKEGFEKALKALLKVSDKELSAEEADKAIAEISKIIDKDGFIVTIGIKDGYIVYEKFSITLKEEEEKIHLDLIANFFDINKEMEIKIPNKDEVKSMDLMELMGVMMGAGIE